MSTGSMLLKAAPEADQLADRLAGGPGRGSSSASTRLTSPPSPRWKRAIEVTLRRLDGLDMAVTAEAPLAWPSGAFVSVDRLDEEARAGIERSAEFAKAVGSPVLTLHLFVPRAPDEFDRAVSTRTPSRRSSASTPRRALERGVTPLIENVPPVLRMRTGGVFLSPIGGHWRDLLHWRERVPALGFTLTRPTPRSSAPSRRLPVIVGLASDDELDLARYVEELGPHAEVRTSPTRTACSARACPTGAASWTSTRSSAALASWCRTSSRRSPEPNHRRSEDMKAGYRAIERALAKSTARPRRAVPAVPVDDFDWQAVLDRRDPVPPCSSCRSASAAGACC